MKCTVNTTIDKAKNMRDSLAAHFFRDTSDEMAEVMFKMQGLATVLAKTKKDTIGVSFSKIHNVRTGVGDAKELFGDMLESATGVREWEKVADINNKAVLTNLHFKMDRMMETAIYAGIKPADFAEDAILTKMFVAQFTALETVNRWDRGMRKIFSGEFVRKWLPKEFEQTWDGLIVQKDRDFRQNPVIDSKRSKYRKVINDVEIEIRELMDKAVGIFDKNPSKLLDTNESANLLKYFDADIQRQSTKDTGSPLGELKRVLSEDHNISKDDIPKAIKHMEGIYESWQLLNYGQSGKLALKPSDVDSYDGYYNPRERDGTVLKYMFDLGDNVVDQILSSDIPYSKLDKTQKFFLEKFGDFRKDDLIKKYPDINGDTVVKLDPLQLREGYVPIGKNSELESMLTGLGETDKFRDLDMFGERKAKADATDADFRETLVDELELLRHVGTDIAQYTFALDLDMHLKTKEYESWKVDRGDSNWEMEDGVYKRYAKYMLQHFENRTKPELKNQSGSFKFFKSLGLVALGLQGTMPLMESSLNNRVQAFMGRLNQISFQQWMGLSNNIEKGEMSADPIYRKIAKIVESETKDKIKGRNAAFVLSDVDTKKRDILLKKGFELAEASMSYGHALPFVGLLKGIQWISGMKTDKAVSAMKDSKWFSMTGSEQVIRNFNGNIVMNQVSAKYLAMEAAGMIDKKTFDPEKFVKDILKDNQYEFDRYDQVLHGDFGKDTKPFSAYKINDAETYRDLFIGLAASQFYMFRQASMFGLIGSVAGGIVKPLGYMKGAGSGVGTGPKPSVLATSNIGVAAPMIIATSALYEFMSDMLFDDPIRFSALNAVNQVDPILMSAELGMSLMAPILDLPVTEIQHKKILNKVVKFGSGMILGNSLEEEGNTSMLEDWKKTLTISNIFNKTIEPGRIWIDMLTDGVNVGNSKDFKDRMRSRATGVGMIDATVGPGSDLIRFILNSTFTAATFLSENKKRDRDKTAYLRVNALKSMTLSKLGFSYYTFDNTEGRIRRNNAMSFMSYNNTINDMKNGHLDATPEGNAGKVLTWMENGDNKTNPYFGAGK